MKAEDETRVIVVMVAHITTSYSSDFVITATADATTVYTPSEDATRRILDIIDEDFKEEA